MSSRFHGLSAFPLTPADENGCVDVEALSRLVERLDAAQVDSVGLLGSTGSYAYLSRAERLRAVQAAAECLKGTRTLMVGVGALRTDEAMALARDAENAGADALLLAPVSYTPLTQEEAYHHFAAVAGATALPLCIYNNPSTTHFTFSDELLVRLAYIPHILSVKMPLAANMEFKPELERLRPRLGDDLPSVTAVIGVVPMPCCKARMPGTALLAAFCRCHHCVCCAPLRQRMPPKFSVCKAISSRFGLCSGSSAVTASSMPPPISYRSPTASRRCPSCRLASAIRSAWKMLWQSSPNWMACLLPRHNSGALRAAFTAETYESLLKC